MNKPMEPTLPSIRLRLDRFEQFCAVHVSGKSTAARAEFIGVSRPQLAKVARPVAPATPGQGFIAATILAFRGKAKTTGEIFDALFEIVPIDDAESGAEAA
jgi:hypothetical protein